MHSSNLNKKRKTSGWRSEGGGWKDSARTAARRAGNSAAVAGPSSEARTAPVNETRWIALLPRLVALLLGRSRRTNEA
jgi:hypothetical protein